MYSTDKEVHVYIDGAIQNAFSDRQQSLHPQFIDMILNNAVKEYIRSKFPNRADSRDIEGSLDRYSKFEHLKKHKSVDFVIDANAIYPIAKASLPTDSIKIESARLSYYLGIASTATRKRTTITLTCSDNMYNATSCSVSLSYTSPSNQIIAKSYNLATILAFVASKDGMFYFYNSFVDLLKADGFDVTYVNRGNSRIITITLPIGSYSVISTSNNTNVVTKIATIDESYCTNQLTGASRVSLKPSINTQIDYDDYYSSRNLHLNPIGELKDSYLEIPMKGFTPITAIINYIQDPGLFDINTGSIPNIEIDKEFLDYAVKQVLLILGSQDFNKVVNETINHQ